MNPSLQEHLKEFRELKLYLEVLPKAPLPFSRESRLVYDLLLKIQSAFISEPLDLLEIGVEHGGSGLLSLCHARDGETQWFVDIVKSPHFADSLAKLPNSVRERAKFLECSGQDAATNVLTSRTFRWLHIDAAHDRQSVYDDMCRFAPLLDDQGILVMDDFFQPAWPGVTEAIIDFLRETSVPLLPKLIGFNKLYLMKPGPATDRMMNEVDQVLMAHLNHHGKFRRFDRVFLGEPVWCLHGRVAAGERKSGTPRSSRIRRWLNR